MKNELAASFYRLGLINIAKKEYFAAFMSFLKAAWCFDDRNDVLTITLCENK
ncbi:MAG: hypothetical protein K6C68_11320 [Ruminococcus sp.]|nr:hypothetical protein [Ruminococcus sp.]